MGLKIMLLIGLALVLCVGFCIVDVMAGETIQGENPPFTVTIYESFHSIIEWFTGTDENAAAQSAQEGAAEKK